MTIAYAGVGSNLQEPVRQVEAAFATLDRIAHTRLVKRSSLYRSAPLGYARQPRFVNAVAMLDTALAPQRLLEELQGIEARQGRQRSFANAPRTLDLDLLLFGDLQQSEPALTLPHPRMHERAFVLEPLLDLAPGATVPGKGSAAACLEACRGQSVEKIA